jgi:hypothetical protein
MRITGLTLFILLIAAMLQPEADAAIPANFLPVLEQGNSSHVAR